jgi:hypothetical protein
VTRGEESLRALGLKFEKQLQLSRLLRPFKKHSNNAWRQAISKHNSRAATRMGQNSSIFFTFNKT